MSAISLGHRLLKIKDNIGPGYEHIWDCCCDHGHLGISLIETNSAPNIHFVDCVPKIIEDLNIKLNKHFSNHSANWQTHCVDASKLIFEANNSNHLVILSGIGGDLMLQLIKEIHSSNPLASIDYLLCPIRQLYKLRSELNSLQFKVKNECLVEEKNRLYEVILLAPPSSSKDTQKEDYPTISATGQDIWKTNFELSKKYYSEIVGHYQKMLNSGSSEVKGIINAYENAAKRGV